MMRAATAFSTLLTYPFRIFFVLAAVYALLTITAWVGFLFAGWSLPLGWSPPQWHSHEMLYGFVGAALTGFLLTAMTNWTGATPLTGGHLLALVCLWLAGRLAFWLAGWLPSLWVAVIDLAFFPVLAIYVSWILLRYHNKRNLILVVRLTLLTAANLLMHCGLIHHNPAWLSLGQALALDVVTLLMVVIAGRITPAFSANWLRQHQGQAEKVIRSTSTDALAIGSVALLLVASALPTPDWGQGSLALAAAATNGLRLWQWSGWRTWREPLLWILHLSYAWIVLALLLRGIFLLTGSGSASLWHHTLTIGGMGTLILGVMTRVAVGHTGRPLRLPAYGLLIYLAITAAALLRLAAASQWIDYRLGVSLAALSWVVAFGLFLILYFPILSSPRPDGRPG